MSKTTKEYCVLRIPKSTRKAIIKIALSQPFKSRWTDVANQILIKGIEKHNK